MPCGTGNATLAYNFYYLIRTPAPQPSVPSFLFKHALFTSVSWDATRTFSHPALTELRGTTITSAFTCHVFTMFIVFFCWHWGVNLDQQLTAPGTAQSVTALDSSEPRQTRQGEMHLHSQRVPGLPHAKAPPDTSQTAELCFSDPASPSTEAHDVLDGFSSLGPH